MGSTSIYLAMDDLLTFDTAFGPLNSIIPGFLNEAPVLEEDFAELVEGYLDHCGLAGPIRTTESDSKIAFDLFHVKKRDPEVCSTWLESIGGEERITTVHKAAIGAIIFADGINELPHVDDLTRRIRDSVELLKDTPLYSLVVAKSPFLMDTETLDRVEFHRHLKNLSSLNEGVINLGDVFLWQSAYFFAILEDAYTEGVSAVVLDRHMAEYEETVNLAHKIAASFLFRKYVGDGEGFYCILDDESDSVVSAVASVMRNTFDHDCIFGCDPAQIPCLVDSLRIGLDKLAVMPVVAALNNGLNHFGSLGQLDVSVILDNGARELIKGAADFLQILFAGVEFSPKFRKALDDFLKDVLTQKAEAGDMPGLVMKNFSVFISEAMAIMSNPDPHEVLNTIADITFATRETASIARKLLSGLFFPIPDLQPLVPVAYQLQPKSIDLMVSAAGEYQGRQCGLPYAVKLIAEMTGKMQRIIKESVDNNTDPQAALDALKDEAKAIANVPYCDEGIEEDFL